jgi:hypothetical protein
MKRSFIPLQISDNIFSVYIVLIPNGEYGRHLLLLDEYISPEGGFRIHYL